MEKTKRVPRETGMDSCSGWGEAQGARLAGTGKAPTRLGQAEWVLLTAGLASAGTSTPAASPVASEHGHGGVRSRGQRSASGAMWYGHNGRPQRGCCSQVRIKTPLRLENTENPVMSAGSEGKTCLR